MVTGSQISLGGRFFAPPRTHVAFSPRRAPPPHATVGLVVGGVDMKVTPERDAAERVAKDAFLATLSNPYPNPDGEADDPPSTSYAIAAAEALLVRAATTRDAKQFPPMVVTGAMRYLEDHAANTDTEMVQREVREFFRSGSDTD